MYGRNDIYNSPMQPGHGVFAETLQVTMDEIDDEFGDDADLDEEMGAILGIGKGGGVLGMAVTQKAKKKKVARLLGKLKKFIELEEAGKKVNINKVYRHAKAMNRTLSNLEKKGYELSDEEQAWREFVEAGKGNEEAWEDLKDKLGTVSVSTGEQVTMEDLEAEEEYVPRAPGGLVPSSGSGVRGGGAAPRPMYPRHPAGWRPPVYASWPNWRKKRWLARHPRLASARNPYDPPGWRPGMALPAPRAVVVAPRRGAPAPRRGAPRAVVVAPRRGAPAPRRAAPRTVVAPRGGPRLTTKVAPGVRVGPRGGTHTRQAPGVWSGPRGATYTRQAPGQWTRTGPRGGQQRMVRYGLEEAIEAGVEEVMGAIPGTIGADAFENLTPSGLLRADILESRAIDDLLDAEDMLGDDDDDEEAGFSPDDDYGMQDFDDFGVQDFDDFGAWYGEDEDEVTVRKARLQEREQRRIQRAEESGPAGRGPFRRKLTARLAALEKKYKHQVETGHPDVNVTLKKLEAVRAHYNEMLGKPRMESVSVAHQTTGIEDVPLFQSSSSLSGGLGSPGVTEEGEFTLASADVE